VGGCCNEELQPVDYEICFDASPENPAATGLLVSFHDDERTIEEQATWNMMYPTTYNRCVDGGKQNHGAAMGNLCELNSWNLPLMYDFEFTEAKAKDSMKAKNPAAAIQHLISQTKRFGQRAVSGALMNGLQLNLQITALAMLQYDRPFSETSVQPLFAIFVVEGILWSTTITAMTVLCRALKWKRGIRKSLTNVHPDNPEKVNEEVRPLEQSIRLLGMYILLCVMVVGYATAKFIMILYCPYSLWNVNGCWHPPADFPELQNSTSES
jgi:hypothetical protein